MSQLLQVPARNGLNVFVGATPPPLFHGGLPYENATDIAVDLTGPVAYHHQGLPFTAEGRLAVTEDPPTEQGPGAMPLASGRLCMQNAVPAEYIPGGVGVTVGGQIAAAGLAPYLGVTITDQPDDVMVVEPAQAQFSITASSGDASPINYQWQEFTGSWNNITDGGAYSGATTNTLTINPTSLALSGNRYRCVCSNAQPGTVTSNAADLIVTSAETFFVKTFDGNDDVLTFDGVDNVLTFDGTP